MKTNPTLTAVLAIACLAAPAWAGDGNPFAPKRFTFEFDSPFQGWKEFKFKQAKLTIEFGPSASGIVPWEIRYARPTSMVVELGAQHLTVPPDILADIQNLNLSDLNFVWVAGQYHLKFTAGLGPDIYGDFRFSWRDGKLTGFTVEHNDMTSRYAEVFKAAPEQR